MWRQLQSNLSIRKTSGFIYAYTDGDGKIKVGRMNCLERRIREWDTQCPNPNRVWLGWIWTNYSHRLGK